MNRYDREKSSVATTPASSIGFASLGVTLLILVAFGGIAGCGSFSRWQGAMQQSYERQQRLFNEQNQVQVNDIQIAQTQQLVQVQKQKALIKIEEAKGIAQAQRIINGTLTPLYLQHEAIEAMQEHANLVFVPSGPMGLPTVLNPSDYMKTTSPSAPR